MGLSPLAIVVNALLGFVGVGAILYAVAVTLDNATRRHRLIVEANRLHNDYQRRLAEVRGESLEPDPLQDVEPDFEAIPIDEAPAASDAQEPDDAPRLAA
jgi:hypothetical protein